MKPTIITIPWKFTPRPYQVPFLAAMARGFLRAILIWHRKSGKEKVCWNHMILRSMERVGNYWYFFQKLTTGRTVVWDGIDQDGVRFLDHLPPGCVLNSTLMLARMPNGSTIQLLGAEEFDTNIGGNPVGVTFSEYPLSNPFVWSFIRPILANNGGWAVFNGTPRGENHAFDLWNLAIADPKNWFHQMMTVEDTKAVPAAVLAQERKEIVRLNGNDALYQQEYMCSFSVPLAGAYYAEHIQRAYREGRVSEVPIMPQYLVDTWWDLGKGDNMAVWLVQAVGWKLNIIDYMTGVGNGMVDFIAKLRQRAQDQGYQLGRFIGPHDLSGTEIFTGKTRLESAASIGVDFEVAPKLRVDDGIDAVRNLWPRLWFDRERCADGINALKNYTKKWDEKRKIFSDTPDHTWASHPADALRTGAVAIDFNEAGRPVRGDAYEEPTSRQVFSPMAS